MAIKIPKQKYGYKQYFDERTTAPEIPVTAPTAQSTPGYTTQQATQSNVATGVNASTGTGTNGVVTNADTVDDLAAWSAKHGETYLAMMNRIESERQRGVNDARASYEQNKASYGTNAEQLARMGLTGGGYSDYINQQAYATQREQVQAANAQASSEKLNVDLSYAQIQEEQAANQQQNYTEALQSMYDGSGYINAATIDAMLQTNQISQTHYDALANAYREQQQKLITPDMFNDVSDVDAEAYYKDAMNDKLLTDAQKEEIQTAYQNKGVIPDKSVIEFNNNAGSKKVKGDYGDNFSVKVNGNILRVEKGYKATEEIGKKLDVTYNKLKGKNASTHDVMVHDGVVYMKLDKGDKFGWYVVQARENSYPDDFKKMCDALGITVYSRGIGAAE